ncbi:MAG: T9SS type A sorting domain-containing protein [Robiginitalea sp.]
MKHFYVLFFFLMINLGFGQQTSDKGEIEGFKLYPNPVTQGRVYIVTAQNSPKKIRVFDVLGTPVLQTTILGNELNISELTAGIYLIQVYEKDKVATRKLIVK